MSAPKFSSVEEFLASRAVWQPDAIDGDVDPKSPPTVPKTKGEAGRRFLCKLLKAQLDGADCAARCVRTIARKDAATLCFGCPAGEARAQLLGVTTDTLDQRREEQKKAASKASRKRDSKKVAELNQRVTLTDLRRPAAKAPRRRPARPAAAARQVGRKAQAGATPKARTSTSKTRRPKPKPARRPGRPGPWDGVDLTRPTAELMAELGVTETAVYAARRRRGVRMAVQSPGDGWYALRAIVAASPLSPTTTRKRLQRLSEAGELQRKTVARTTWYLPTCDAGRALIESLLAGQVVPSRTHRRIDWSGVDLLRPLHELCAELGTHPDTVRNRRKKVGVVVPERRPAGRGWKTVGEMVAAGNAGLHAVRRRARRMRMQGHLEHEHVGNRAFYRPADERGADWFRNVFDSRPVVSRDSVRAAADGLLTLLAGQGAVERRGSTNDTVWRVIDEDAVRRAGLQIEQRGRAS